MSARLRGAAQFEDGWQEIPDEWLKDRAEENDGASASEHDEDVEMGADSEPKPELDPDPETEPDEEMGAQVGKTGLESDDDAVSELTELSEITPPATVVVTRPTSRQNSKKSGGSRKKPSQSRGRTLTIETSAPEDEIEPEWRPPDNFVEWETVRFFLIDLPSSLDNNPLSRSVLPCLNGSRFVNASKVLRIMRRRRCTNYFLSKLYPLLLRSFG